MRGAERRLQGWGDWAQPDPQGEPDGSGGAGGVCRAVPKPVSRVDAASLRRLMLQGGHKSASKQEQHKREV